MRAAAGFGSPNRRNRSMPRPPLFGRTAALCGMQLASTITLRSASSSHCSSLCCDVVDECSVCRLLLFGSSSGRDSQSFQHRTFRPVHACSLDSGLPRYDNLTVSDSPPQHQVLCSLLRHSRSCCRLTTPEASLTGTGTVPACTACSPRSAWVLSPCIATLDSIRVRA